MMPVSMPVSGVVVTVGDDVADGEAVAVGVALDVAVACGTGVVVAAVLGIRAMLFHHVWVETTKPVLVVGKKSGCSTVTWWVHGGKAGK